MQYSQSTHAQVTKDMIIADVAAKYPASVHVMLSYGLHCIGCHANTADSIEAGALLHGIAPEEIDTMIAEINKAIAAKPPQFSAGAESGTMEENITITERAAIKVKAMMETEGATGKGFRVQVVPGGCSGMSYHFDFDNKKNPDDVVSVQHGLNVFIDKNSLRFAGGATIDYVETLKESGFKISNPKAKGSCGCGSSFTL
ncbi:iron-sulfur cluster assembly accessory protein [Candidatus Woesearchaeota archaeon]|nr:iron-sulfur cluster assembly accessory protein [Candidatus Woesearchaeota archaeon]